MSRLFPPAKINLGLRILGRRSSGYHELFSLIMPLPELHDILDIAHGERDGLELLCDCAAITDTNLIQKTYNIFCEQTGFFPPLRVRLEKKIPIGAGLGGGSSDAACFLKYLAGLCPNPPDEAELLSLAMKIGADLPFFLLGRPSLVCGSGEIVRPLQCPLPQLHLLLVWPEVHISTAWAFQAYDRQGGNTLPSSSSGSKKDLTKLNVKATQIFPAEGPRIEDIIDCLHNDLEGPVFSKYPSLGELKREILEYGALGAAMSGSGSSIYGLFSDVAGAEKAAWGLRGKYRTIYHIST